MRVLPTQQTLPTRAPVSLLQDFLSPVLSCCTTAAVQHTDLPLGSHDGGVQEAEKAEELYISHLLQSLRSLTLLINSPDFPLITFGLLLNGNPKYCQQGSEQRDKLT